MARKGHVYGEDTVWQRELEETFPFQGKVTESGVRFREGPDVRTGRILAELSAGVKVTVTSKVGDWYYVILENEVGYIHSDFIERVDD